MAGGRAVGLIMPSSVCCRRLQQPEAAVPDECQLGRVKCLGPNPSRTDVFPSKMNEATSVRQSGSGSVCSYALNMRYEVFRHPQFFQQNAVSKISNVRQILALEMRGCPAMGWAEALVPLPWAAKLPCGTRRCRGPVLKCFRCQTAQGMVNGHISCLGS